MWSRTFLGYRFALSLLTPISLSLLFRSRDFRRGPIKCSKLHLNFESLTLGLQCQNSSHCTTQMLLLTNISWYDMVLPCSSKNTWVIGSPSHYSLQFLCLCALEVGTLEEAQSSVQSCTQKTKSNPPFNHHNFSVLKMAHSRTSKLLQALFALERTRTRLSHTRISSMIC